MSYAQEARPSGRTRSGGSCRGAAERLRIKLAARSLAGGLPVDLPAEEEREEGFRAARLQPSARSSAVEISLTERDGGYEDGSRGRSNRAGSECDALPIDLVIYRSPSRGRRDNADDRVGDKNEIARSGIRGATERAPPHPSAEVAVAPSAAPAPASAAAEAYRSGSPPSSKPDTKTKRKPATSAAGPSVRARQPGSLRAPEGGRAKGAGGSGGVNWGIQQMTALRTYDRSVTVPLIAAKLQLRKRHHACTMGRLLRTFSKWFLIVEPNAVVHKHYPQGAPRVRFIQHEFSWLLREFGERLPEAVSPSHLLFGDIPAVRCFVMFGFSYQVDRYRNLRATGSALVRACRNAGSVSDGALALLSPALANAEDDREPSHL